MFNSGKTSYLEDIAIILFAVAIFATYGLLNIASELYLRRCEQVFNEIQNSTYTPTETTDENWHDPDWDGAL